MRLGLGISVSRVTLAAVIATVVSLADYGLTDWDPGIGVRRVAAGQYEPTKEYAVLLSEFKASTTVQQYFVDSINGADANNGASATPWQRVHTAWTQNPSGATTVEIIVRPPASRILWGSRGMTNGSVATKNIIIRAEDGGELIVAGGPNVVPPSWTDNGDGTYTCSSGVTNTVVSVPMDWSPQARAETTDGDGRPFAQTITASALDAAGRAALQPGQAHKNSATGTNDLTIRPFGNRAASVWRDYVTPGMQPGSNFRVALFDSTPDSLKFWLGRIKPCGGTPFAFQNQRTSVGGRGEIYTDRCGVFSSSGNQNGQAVVGAWRVINFDPTSDAIGADALNAHNGTNGNSAWATGPAWVVHVRPKTLTVGLSATGVDNSDTGHGECRGLTIMPKYRGGNGRPYAWINTSLTWCFGGSIGPSSRTTAQGYFETVSAGNTARMTLVEVAVAQSPNGNLDISADSGASVKCYGMTQGALRISGDVTFQALLSATPVLPLRVALEGDSYSESKVGYAGLWPTANPSVPFKNFAVGGSSLVDLVARLDTVIADQPSILTALVGANDLRGAASAEEYAERVLSYFAQAKAKRPGLITVAAEVMPVGPTVDANGKHALFRPTVNALLRQAVGQGRIDALIPFGTHPAMVDAAAQDTNYYANDQLHPGGLTYDIMFRVYSAVLNPIVAGATATSPTAPSFTAEANRELSTAYTSNLAYVTGMKAGSKINVATTGAGTSSAGQSAFNASAKTVMNGDVLRLRQTSSNANSTPVATTVTLGTASGTYTVTTKVAGSAAITAAAGDAFRTPTGFATVKSFDMPLRAGRPVIAVELDGGSGYDASSMTINGKACTKTAGAGGMFIFVGPEELAAGTYPMVYTSSANAVNSLLLLPVALTNAGDATVGGSSVLAWSYKSDGVHTATPALTIGSGGIGVIFYYNTGAVDGSSFTKAGDQTLLKSFGNQWSALSTTTSGAPSVTSKQASTDCLVAVAVNL